jgi:hypothetical protein
MNKKISELVSATSLMAADAVVMNQNGQTKKITISDLFSSGIPVSVNIKNKLIFGATPDLVTNGAISLEVPITNVILSTNGSITMTLGAEGQIKTVVATAGVGATSLTGNLYNSSILFNRIGATAIMLFTAGKWAFLGGTATPL